ncbi:MAG TPA: TIGR04283 family arsenosugar biosynthesis glycosyltransferase [Pyrinomonadaceae bacterium]|nr:TIGR04283 family arsenosugar biosynthesis glycosyltransferase [Pyrinomonadaceae bacterium]
MSLRLSIIIPALNEAATIKETLDALRAFRENAEIIVVDGGSVDETILIARNCGVSVLQSKGRGRGAQMREGAKAANGDVLWFLHADTRPAPETIEQMTQALENAQTVVGNFTVCFDGDCRGARFLTRLYPQLRKINLFYGDSAIFVRRDVYEKVSGFRDFPIFEDLDLVRRVKREGQTIHLPARVVTSSRRFENKSFTLVFLRWTILQVFYWLGVSPHRLVKLYPPHK